MGGAWTDFGGYYGGMRFASRGSIIAIMSIDGGVTWLEDDTDIDLTVAEGGVWESDAGGFGTYTIVGDDMTWVNDATATTLYFTQL